MPPSTHPFFERISRHHPQRRASLLESHLDSLSPAERRRVRAAQGLDQVYDFQKWRDHRKEINYLYHLLSLPMSHTLHAISGPLIWVLLVCICVGLNSTLATKGMLPRWLILPKMSNSMEDPLTITSFALSLLLVFRTNSSYGRFDEARKLWGLLLNRSRDLVRQSVAFFPPAAWEARATFARWVIVFSKALLCHVRNGSSLREEAGELLTKEELQILLAVNHYVVTCIQVLSELVEASGSEPLAKYNMHTNLTTLHDILGGCERLLRTPIPVAYTRHTTRFVILWVTLLPYALWQKFGWATIPIALLTALLLLGINEIGVDVEEPFSILPLESIADRISLDCRELIQTQLLMADRFIEARSQGMNHHVFPMATHEDSTALLSQPDLVPLTRSTRVTMVDGILGGPNGSPADFAVRDNKLFSAKLPLQGQNDESGGAADAKRSVRSCYYGGASLPLFADAYSGCFSGFGNRHAHFQNGEVVDTSAAAALPTGGLI